MVNFFTRSYSLDRAKTIDERQRFLGLGGEKPLDIDLFVDTIELRCSLNKLYSSPPSAGTTL
jgi:hypothetical protein